MFEDEYDDIFARYKEYMKNKSIYNPHIVKFNTNEAPNISKEPLITCVLSDNKDTNYSTVDGFERYNEFYFTINIYTKDIIKGQNVLVSSHEVIKELSKLTDIFFGEILNMKKTLDKPTPNFDTSILRKTKQYQCLIGNVRGNIVRR